ncbi:MAG: hypothetical protein J6Y19_05425 [Kiritimatiellae bacterium]|nr:hypothetical protein [Kiritimatiellia bacterium]
MSTGQASWRKALAAGMAVAAWVFLAGSAGGAEVRNVTAKQRYPWNGLVDIRCTVTGIEDGVIWPLTLSAEEPDSGAVHELSHFRVVREGTNSSDRAVRANGEYELLWDARADLGEVVCSNMVVRVAFDAHPMVQLWEDGPYWADRNIGAEEPWEYGYYFWWGDTVGYKWEDEQWVASDGSAVGFVFENAPTWGLSVEKLRSQGWTTTNNVLAPEHDAAHVQWGGEWRMPTEQELRDLCDKCDRTWVTTNGVKGYVVRGRDDYASASIFLPAAGWGDKAILDRVGQYGHLWASDPRTDNRSWRLNYRSGQFFMDYHYDRHVGTSFRPIRGSAE